MKSQQDSISFTLLGAGMQKKALPQPVVLAHYLPWFTLQGDDWPLSEADRKRIPVMPHIDNMRHWRDPGSGYQRSHLHLPRIGIYDSRDPAVIDWQICIAKAAGINGFVINWYGQNSVENVITLHFLNRLAHWNQTYPDQQFGYMFCIDSQAQLPTEGKTPVPLEEDFEYLRRHLIRDGYLMRSGKPVFACFAYAADPGEWLTAGNKVWGKGAWDLIWSDTHTPHGTTASYLWAHPDETSNDRNSDYSWPNPDSSGATHARQRYAEWEKPESGLEYGMAGIWPGFNDQLVTWAWGCPTGTGRLRPRIIARETSLGNTYDLMWKVYLKSLQKSAEQNNQPFLPLAQLVTWNDYAEASTIEPSRDFGSVYLEKTRHYIQEARRTVINAGGKMVEITNS